MTAIEGTFGSDTLKGGSKADVISGLGGDDELNGKGNADTLIGGSGDDLLNGGGGKDIYRYDDRGFGQDTIEGFAKGEKIDLSALHVADFATLEPYIEQTPDGALISFTYNGATESIFLDGYSSGKLSDSSFIFNTSTKKATVTGNNYGDDVLFGGAGNDKLEGLGADDELNGGAGKDTLIGGSGDDLLRGGADKDVYRYDDRGFGQDTIEGFAKGEKIDLSALHVADFATLEPYIEQTPDGALITLTYNGATESIFLDGYSASALKGSSFVFDKSSKGLTVTGNNYGDDVLFGGKGADRLEGLGADDELNGGAGKDTLIGGSGDDLLRGGKSDDVFRYDDRGFGRDTIEGFSQGDKIDLSALHVADLATLSPYIEQTSDGALITLTYNGATESIFLEGVSTSELTASSFVFNASANGLTVTGNNYGDDVLFGGAGADRLEGLGADDELNGGAGADTLIGGSGDDLFRGGEGDDLFRYDDRGFGRDTIEGFVSGDKIDLSSLHVADLATLSPYIEQTPDGALISLTYNGATESIFLKGVSTSQLTASSFVFDTGASGLTVTGNNYGDDVLFGGNGNDRLEGLGADDELNAGAGNDTLIGGGGQDVLRGGAGHDVFRFDYLPSSGSSADEIVDFTHGEDAIELVGSVFAALGGGALGADAFYAGVAAHDSSDRVIYDKSSGTLLYDADGDGAKAAVRIATLTSHPDLSSADFTVV